MKRIMIKTALAAAGLVLMMGTTGAWAVDLHVTASVTASCVVSTPNDLEFGTFDSNVAVNKDASSDISIKCTQGSGYRVNLNAGANAVASGFSIPNRALISNGNYLAYKIYFTSRTAGNEWGGTAGAESDYGRPYPSHTTTETGGGATSNVIPVLGQILVADINAAPAGDYTDDVTITTSFHP